MAVELRQSVSIYLYLQYQNDTNNFRNNISATIFLIYSFQFTNLKLQTSNLANEHLDRIKSLKDLQFRILDQVNILTLYSITYYYWEIIVAYPYQFPLFFSRSSIHGRENNSLLATVLPFQII